MYPEHPLVSNIDSLTEEQLRNKITELNRNLRIAYTMSAPNAYLINQIQMLLNSYNTRYQEVMRKGGNDGEQFKDIIDVK